MKRPEYRKYSFRGRCHMLANFGMELKPPVLPEEIIEVLAHCGGVEIVEELLEKYGHPTLSYLPCIANLPGL